MEYISKQEIIDYIGNSYANLDNFEAKMYILEHIKVMKSIIVKEDGSIIREE